MVKRVTFHFVTGMSVSIVVERRLIRKIKNLMAVAFYDPYGHPLPVPQGALRIEGDSGVSLFEARAEDLKPVITIS